MIECEVVHVVYCIIYICSGIALCWLFCVCLDCCVSLWYRGVIRCSLLQQKAPYLGLMQSALCVAFVGMRDVLQCVAA